jgi:hypothetical protein
MNEVGQIVQSVIDQQTGPLEAYVLLKSIYIKDTNRDNNAQLKEAFVHIQSGVKWACKLDGLRTHNYRNPYDE